MRTVKVYDDIIYYVPNAFTPNGDGTNDVFFPVLTAGLDLSQYQLLIFNRWGEVVFESRDYDYRWDGTYPEHAGQNARNQNMAQDDVYVWKIRVVASQSQETIELVGHVTLLK